MITNTVPDTVLNIVLIPNMELNIGDLMLNIVPYLTHIWHRSWQQKEDPLLAQADKEDLLQAQDEDRPLVQEGSPLLVQEEDLHPAQEEDPLLLQDEDLLPLQSSPSCTRRRSSPCSCARITARTDKTIFSMYKQRIFFFVF